MSAAKMCSDATAPTQFVSIRHARRLSVRLAARLVRSSLPYRAESQATQQKTPPHLRHTAEN